MLPIPEDETLAKLFGPTWVDVNVNEVRSNSKMIRLLNNKFYCFYIIMTLTRFFATGGMSMKISKIVTGPT